MKLVKNIYFSVREIWKASRSALFFLIFLAGFSAFFTICDVIYIKYYFALVFLSKIVAGIIAPLFANALEGKVMSCSNSTLYKKVLSIGAINYNNTGFYNKLSIAMRESGIRYFQ